MARFRSRWALLAAVAAASAGHAVIAGTVSSAFTYQGRLTDSAGPVEHPALPVVFQLYDAASSGSPASEPLNMKINVIGGAFTAHLDFGAGIFSGEQRWLEVTVNGNVLSPRQEITAAPYAWHTRGLNVDAAGNLGIRVASPGAGLHVDYDPLAEVGVFAGDLAPFGYAAFESNSSTGATHAWFAENGERVFSVMAGGQAYVGGNLGIGTTTPAFPLSFPQLLGDKIALWGDSGETYGFGIQPGLLQIHCDGPASAVAFGYGESANFTESMRVLGDGRVGIGTTAPAARLHVAGQPGVDGIMFPDGTLQTSAAGSSQSPQYQNVTITGGANPFGAIGWGNNEFGQSGSQGETLTAISMNDEYGLGLTPDGTIVAWGQNSPYLILNPPNDQGPFIAVSAGETHALALRADGTIVVWGDNREGQLNFPPGVYTAISAGSFISAGILADGTLIVVGPEWEGRLNVPPGQYSAVDCGRGLHMLAIRTDGTLAGWGANGSGQADVPEGTYTAISGGAYHSVAIRSDGSLEAWGESSSGQTNLPPQDDWVYTAVAAGRWHNVALRSDGQLEAWGSENHGALNVPPGTFVAIAAGDNNAMAIPSTPPEQPALRLMHDSAFKPGTSTWTIWSDRRLKKNIQPLENSLEKLLQLRGVTFDWRDPASQGNRTATEMGMIADEVEKVFPNWVGRDSRGYRTLTIGGFEGLTAEAVRELRAEKDSQIAQQQRQLDLVKHENAELRGRLEQIEAALGRTNR